jgi:hypothetical protein
MSVGAQSKQTKEDGHPSVTCLPIVKRDRGGSPQSDCEFCERNAGRRALSKDLGRNSCAQFNKVGVLNVRTQAPLVDRRMVVVLCKADLVEKERRKNASRKF